MPRSSGHPSLQAVVTAATRADLPFPRHNTTDLSSDSISFFLKLSIRLLLALGVDLAA